MNPIHRYTVLAGLLSVTTITPALAAETACPQHFAGGQAPDLVNQGLAPRTAEICFAAFAALHSGLSRTALWSAERLTRASLASASYLKRDDEFHAENALPKKDRAELSDYARSGFDRGHLAPSRNMPTMAAQRESFSLANMVPQVARHNRYIWEGIESATRTLAERRGEIYTVTGPVFAGERLQSLKGRVLVPTHLFKAVYDPATGQAGAYLSPNDESEQWTSVSIATLEKTIGWTLFPGLPEHARQAGMDLPEPTPHFKNGGARKVKW